MFGIARKIKFLLFLLLIILALIVGVLIGASFANPKVAGFLMRSVVGVNVDLPMLLQEQGITVLSSADPYTSGGFTYYPLDGVPASIAIERIRILVLPRAQVGWGGMVGEIARKIAGLDKVDVLAVPEER